MDNLEQFIAIYDNLLTAGVISSQKDLAKLLQASEGTVSRAMKGDPKTLTPRFMKRMEIAAKKVLAHDAFKQEGISITNSPNSPVATNNSRIDFHKVDYQEQPGHHSNLVPTIPFKVYNETGINLQEYVQKNQVPMGPAIAQFAQTDLHMFVSNDEMKPHLRSGDVLSLKRVPEEAPIVNGEIYVINSHYLGLTVRFLFDRGTHYELKSSNEWFETFSLPKEQVFGIYRILGLVRTNL